MNELYTIIDNEGEDVNVTYGDGSHERAHIDRLLVQNDCVAALLTMVERDEQVVSIYDSDASDDVVVDIYHDSELVNRLREGTFDSQPDTTPDRQVVAVDEMNGSDEF